MVKGNTVGSAHGVNCTKTNAVSNLICAKVKSRKQLFYCVQETQKQQDEVLELRMPCLQTKSNMTFLLHLISNSRKLFQEDEEKNKRIQLA